LSEREAEEQELLVHIHFDAKYRVEDLESLFGAEDADEELDGNYKSQDFLKMHAYRDAISRCKSVSVNCPSPLQRHPFWVRRSEGERSEPSAAEPKRGDAAPFS
jgi:predicted component of viral defense system (DUF524 family)